MRSPVVFRRFRVALLLLAVCWLALAGAWFFVVAYGWRAVGGVVCLVLAGACARSAREARRMAERLERGGRR